MTEKYFAIKYYEYLISFWSFNIFCVIIFAVILIAVIREFIERRKGNKHGN